MAVMDWLWVSSNLATIVSALSFVGYVVASLSFIISMKTEMMHLGKKLDRCEEEISELRELVINLVMRFTNGKTSQTTKKD